MSFNGQSRGRTSSTYIDPDRTKMSGWDKIRVSTSGARFGSSSTMNERTQSSRTVRLGRVTPQAPTHRTIYCNDREANQPVKFRVCQFFFFLLRIQYIHSCICNLYVRLRVRISEFCFFFFFPLVFPLFC